MEDEKVMQYREEVKEKILEYWNYADTLPKEIENPEVAYPCLEKAEKYCAEFFDMQPYQFDAVALSLAPEVKGLQEKVLRHRAATIANEIEASPELNYPPHSYQVDKPVPMFDLLCRQQKWEDINGGQHGTTNLYDLNFAIQHTNLVMQSLKQGLENWENIKDGMADPSKFEDYEGFKHRKRYEVIESTKEYDEKLEEAMREYDVPSVTISNDNEIMGIDLKIKPVLNAVAIKMLESNTEFVADVRERNVKSSVKEASVGSNASDGNVKKGEGLLEIEDEIEAITKRKKELEARQAEIEALKKRKKELEARLAEVEALNKRKKELEDRLRESNNKHSLNETKDGVSGDKVRTADKEQKTSIWKKLFGGKKANNSTGGKDDY